MGPVLEAERQKSLCLGEETKEHWPLGSLGEVELMGRVCREGPSARADPREKVSSVHSATLLDSGQAPFSPQPMGELGFVMPSVWGWEGPEGGRDELRRKTGHGSRFLGMKWGIS